MTPTLLIDGDIYCYSTAAAFEIENPFTGLKEFDEFNAKVTLNQRINSLIQQFKTPLIKVFFSCNREDNWRRELNPRYKQNRRHLLPPTGLSPLKQHLKTKYPYVEEDRLEADDLIGLYATDENLCSTPTVICSWDKDFLTIPDQMLWNPRKEILKFQTQENAFKYLLYQVITGDTADGYKGIPRMGDKEAMKFINKHQDNLPTAWSSLVDLAKDKGLDENYITLQLQMAFILRKGFYNFETKKIRLITGEDLK